MKRVMDILLSIISLPVVLVIFIIVIIAIQIEEPGSPIFFVQKRIGKNGREFNMYKFRSMRVNADLYVDKLRSYYGIHDVMFKMEDDPRVTKIGKFLRRHSIDEIPQLINVLKGEMSLVGPRPALPEEVRRYNQTDMQRLNVLPGCTGIWQVSGRSDVNFKEMIKMDAYYVEHHSLGFDFLIICRTFAVVLFSKGAY